MQFKVVRWLVSLLTKVLICFANCGGEKFLPNDQARTLWTFFVSPVSQILSTDIL